MFEENDVYRCVHLVVKSFGGNAALRASERADALVHAGDLDGAAAWKQILKAVDELQAKERPDGEPLH